jgi:hypothetical protein
MVTDNDRRWPSGLHGTPARFGKLVEYHLFDAPFFSVHGKQAQVLCPGSSPCSHACMHACAHTLCVHTRRSLLQQRA